MNIAALKAFAMAAATMSFTIAVLYFHPREIITALIALPLLLHLVRRSGAACKDSQESLKCWRRMEYKQESFAKFYHSSSTAEDKIR